MSTQSNELPEGTPHYVFSVVLNRSCPQLYSLLARNSEDFISISLRHRGPNDFTAVLKRFGSDGQSEVLFSNGSDFVGALLAMEGSMHAGRWRLDVPWDQRNSTK